MIWLLLVLVVGVGLAILKHRHVRPTKTVMTGTARSAVGFHHDPRGKR